MCDPSIRWPAYGRHTLTPFNWIFLDTPSYLFRYDKIGAPTYLTHDYAMAFALHASHMKDGQD